MAKVKRLSIRAEVGDTVVIRSKSVNVPLEIQEYTGTDQCLIGKIGKVAHIHGPIYYVSIRRDLLAFSEKDLEVVI